MAIFNYLFLTLILLIIVFSIRGYFISRMNIPLSLFMKAMKDESDGFLKDAQKTYEDALREFKKIKPHGKWCHIVSSKMELLQTVIEAQGKARFEPMHQEVGGGILSKISNCTTYSSHFFRDIPAKCNLN
jgi:hypothetical protein